MEEQVENEPILIKSVLDIALEDVKKPQTFRELHDEFTQNMSLIAIEIKKVAAIMIENEIRANESKGELTDNKI